MYICLCRGVREADVQQAGRRGVITPDGLISAFGLDDDLATKDRTRVISDAVDTAVPRRLGQSGL